MKKIYFDNAATTEISENVISEMMKAMKVNYGNPSSTHSHGRNSKAILELSKKLSLRNLMSTLKKLFLLLVVLNLIT